MIGFAALYALAALAAPPVLAAKNGDDAAPRFLEGAIETLAAHAQNVAPGAAAAAQNLGLIPQTVTVEVDNAMDTGGAAVYPGDTVNFLNQLRTIPVSATGDVSAMRKQGEFIFDNCQPVADPNVYRAFPCFVHEEDPLRQWKPHALPAVAALTPDESMRCTDATALAKDNYFPLVQLQRTRFEGFFTVDVRSAANNYKVATPLPIHQNNAEDKDYDELFEMAASGAIGPKDFEAERRSRGDGHDYLEQFCVDELELEVEECGIDLDVANGDVFEAWFVCPAAMAYAQPHTMPHGSGRLHLLDLSWRGTMNPSDPFIMGYFAGDACLSGSIQKDRQSVQHKILVRAKLSEEDTEFLMAVKARIGGNGAVTVFDHKAKLGYYSIVEYQNSGSEGLKYLATNYKNVSVSADVAQHAGSSV